VVPADAHDLLRRGYDAWNRGDIPSLLSLMAEDVEVHPILGAVVAADAHRGHEGVVRRRADIFESDEALRTAGAS
jgi:ketosteroid isomerase-like protein